MMPTQPSDWSEKYTEIACRMTRQEEIDFVYSLASLMSAFLDDETLEFCLERAETFVASDVAVRAIVS